MNKCAEGCLQAICVLGSPETCEVAVSLIKRKLRNLHVSSSVFLETSNVPAELGSLKRSHKNDRVMTKERKTS